MIGAKFVTTAQKIPRYRVTRNFAVARGIIVRSRSTISNIGATLQTLFGANIMISTELCGNARDDAHRSMVDHAGQFGAREHWRAL